MIKTHAKTELLVVIPVNTTRAPQPGDVVSAYSTEDSRGLVLSTCKNEVTVMWQSYNESLYQRVTKNMAREIQEQEDREILRIIEAENKDD